MRAATFDKKRPANYGTKIQGVQARARLNLLTHWFNDSMDQRINDSILGRVLGSAADCS